MQLRLFLVGSPKAEEKTKTHTHITVSLSMSLIYIPVLLNMYLLYLLFYWQFGADAALCAFQLSLKGQIKFFKLTFAVDG